MNTDPRIQRKDTTLIKMWQDNLYHLMTPQERIRITELKMEGKL